jgi:hypothetical protein
VIFFPIEFFAKGIKQFVVDLAKIASIIANLASSEQ